MRRTDAAESQPDRKKGDARAHANRAGHPETVGGDSVGGNIVRQHHQFAVRNIGSDNSELAFLQIAERRDAFQPEQAVDPLFQRISRIQPFLDHQTRRRTERLQVENRRPLHKGGKRCRFDQQLDLRRRISGSQQRSDNAARGCSRDMVKADAVQFRRTYGSHERDPFHASPFENAVDLHPFPPIACFR